MIFAAGFGTRLKPITDKIPKALVPINGKPILEHVISKLIREGIDEIIINVHYLSDQIINFLNKKNNFGIRIEISEEECLLDTGGGLKQASWFFNDNKPFLVYNVDIISNINIKKMLEFHKNSEAIATIAVRNRTSSRYFLFNNESFLCGWKNIKTGEEIISKEFKLLNPLAFSGIHIINPSVFNYMDESVKFSIVETYLKLSINQSILGYNHSNDIWFDIGNIKKMEMAEKFLKEN